MISSAGALLFKVVGDGVLQVLIAHMGGPFWEKKDDRAWSIPKGEYGETDNPREVAEREFEEEMGSRLPRGTLMDLGTIKQSSGKNVTVFALEADFDTSKVQSNLFEMEWPRGSGRFESFPEIDRAEWFDCAIARIKLLKGQVEFLDRLLERLADDGRTVVESSQGERVT